MGEDTEEDGPIGDHCDRCDNVLWPAEETPKFLKCEFEGIEKCPIGVPDAPNGGFILEQDDGVPCIWRYSDDDYNIIYTLGATYSYLRAGTFFGLQFWFYFRHNILDICANGFTNTHIDCGDLNCGKFGTGIVVPV